MRKTCSTVALILAIVASSAAAQRMPWREAGLDERQAAAHLLDRFAFGARPGEIERVVAQGLDRWLEEQIALAVDDSRFAERLADLDAWSMSAEEITRVFPPPPLLRRLAVNEGVIDEAELVDPASDRGDASHRLRRWARRQGYRFQGDLLDQLIAEKVWRAVSSERQLEAVLADFWFNHFNVSLTDFQTRGQVLSYERDAILPGVLGRFGDMLVEVSLHPAMLYYLDNAQSTAATDAATTFETRFGHIRRSRGYPGRIPPPSLPSDDRPHGLNENFARELLELHTLGVDGGYSQEDVIEVARAFTGWTTFPAMTPRGRMDARRVRLESRGTALGYVVRGQFLFRAEAHDAGRKSLLGIELPAGGGFEEGVRVLDHLAHHPATAEHVARKLAIRFVSDDPPRALVERLRARFLASDGSTAELIREIAASPEFWSPAARRQKIKSPFELAVSAVRSLGADVEAAQGIAGWVQRMGQPLFGYQAPSGFPDRAEAWVNSGSLLSRMNFGLQLAAGRVGGVRLDGSLLDGDLEPGSAEEALELWATRLMPGRDPRETTRRLAPIVRDASMTERVEALDPSAEDEAPAPAVSPFEGSSMGPGGDRAGLRPGMPSADGPMTGPRPWVLSESPPAFSPPSPVARIVGLVLGSPEFQRR